MKFNVIGAGTWGVVFSSYLVKNNHDVIVFHRDTPKSNIIIKTKRHPSLPEHIISNKIIFTSRLDDLDLKNHTILAVPSYALPEYIKLINNKDCKFLILSKGFNMESGMLPLELFSTKFNINNIALLSGPNHAEEISNNKPTATVISSKNNNFSQFLQKSLSSKTFRIYTSQDVNGVQIGGAVKNVIAIASGLCEGLKLGDNAQASLVSRGMNEILELSKVYNFKNSTIFGLSGLGDLVATCYSNYSRNKQLGLLLSKGKTLNNSIDEIGMVSEGVNTSKVLHGIIIKNSLNMPICTEIYNILFNNDDPQKSLLKLMTRELKKEI